MLHCAIDILTFSLLSSLLSSRLSRILLQGTSKHVQWPDEWTATTADGRRTAQFEHTLLVVEDGVEALTGKLESSPLQFWERESTVHKGIWLGTSAAAVARQNEINADKLEEVS